MTRMMLLLTGVTMMSLGVTSEAVSAGRESILRELANPFATSRYSRYTVNPFGLPEYSSTSPFQISESTAPSAPTPMVVEVDDAPEFTPLASTSTRPPFRPRVRSPFRPPPRPGL